MADNYQPIAIFSEADAPLKPEEFGNIKGAFVEIDEAFMDNVQALIDKGIHWSPMIHWDASISVEDLAKILASHGGSWAADGHWEHVCHFGLWVFMDGDSVPDSARDSDGGINDEAWRDYIHEFVDAAVTISHWPSVYGSFSFLDNTFPHFNTAVMSHLDLNVAHWGGFSIPSAWKVDIPTKWHFHNFTGDDKGAYGSSNPEGVRLCKYHGDEAEFIEYWGDDYDLSLFKLPEPWFPGDDPAPDPEPEPDPEDGPIVVQINANGNLTLRSVPSSIANQGTKMGWARDGTSWFCDAIVEGEEAILGLGNLWCRVGPLYFYAGLVRPVSPAAKAILNK